MTMPCDDASTKVRAQRFEVFTGVGRRRDWDPSVKAAIVAESYSGLESVSAVARRHDIVPSQLFTWRRELRQQLEAGTAGPIVTLSEPACFVPAVVEPMPAITSSAPRRRRRQRRPRASVVELEMDGIAVKIAPGADKRLITVIEAHKATR